MCTYDGNIHRKLDTGHAVILVKSRLTSQSDHKNEKGGNLGLTPPILAMKAKR